MDHFPSRRELAAFSLSWRQTILGSSGLLSEVEITRLAAHLDSVAKRLEVDEDDIRALLQHIESATELIARVQNMLEHGVTYGSK